jgi:ABC-type antimicrobial peptide transport system permease subunit
MSAAGATRDVVRGLDASLPVYGVRALAEVVNRASARRWITFILIGCASGVALLLGAIGLYGVMSYIVVLRTRELAIRIALGAQLRDVRRMVHLQGLRVAAIGIALGVMGAVALTRTLATLLYEVSPTDPLVLGLSAGFLLVVSAVANWLPTRRIVTISPVTALNAE